MPRFTSEVPQEEGAEEASEDDRRASSALHGCLGDRQTCKHGDDAQGGKSTD